MSLPPTPRPQSSPAGLPGHTQPGARPRVPRDGIFNGNPVLTVMVLFFDTLTSNLRFHD